MKYLVLLVCVALAQDVYTKNLHSKRDDGKIVGGTNVSNISSVPYQAYLLLQQGTIYYQCGGSIISDKVILTAAHCMIGIQKAYITIGSVNAQMGGKQYSSSNFRIHPMYNMVTHDYDIAVIILSKPMALDGTNTRAVALPQTNQTIPSGTLLRVTGWGTTSENGDTSSTLMTVDVHALSNTECSQSYNGITSRMVCAGEKEGGKDSCQGDSGGPAVGVDSGLLLGVVSFGQGCARPGLPGVYARVPALRSWIKMMAGV